MRPSKTVPTRRLVLPDSAESSAVARRLSPDGLRSPAQEGGNVNKSLPLHHNFVTSKKYRETMDNEEMERREEVGGDRKAVQKQRKCEDGEQIFTI